MGSGSSRSRNALKTTTQHHSMQMTDETFLGTVTEIRPKALYLVRLEDGQLITANLASRLRQVTVRLLVGQKVKLRLSKHDARRGQITQIAQ